MGLSRCSGDIGKHHRRRGHRRRSPQVPSLPLKPCYQRITKPDLPKQIRFRYSILYLFFKFISYTSMTLSASTLKSLDILLFLGG